MQDELLRIQGEKSKHLEEVTSLFHFCNLRSFRRAMSFEACVCWNYKSSYRRKEISDFSITIPVLSSVLYFWVTEILQSLSG